MNKHENGAEALIITASGCGQFVKDYPWGLRNDPDYAAKALIVANKAKDLSEVLIAEDLAALQLASLAATPPTIAVHTPCTLQHGQRLPDNLTQVLKQMGFNLQADCEKSFCCGSAGTYSLLQPELANELKQRKLAALNNGQISHIASANIGCIQHLQSGTQTPVLHWIELVADRLPPVP